MALPLADLSFRGNHDLVRRQCRLRRAVDEFGNPLEAPEGAAADSASDAGSDAGSDMALSTASDADLVLPDRGDPSGLLPRMLAGLALLLAAVLALQLSAEQASGRTPAVPVIVDHYAVLGVPRSAELGDINRAFRARSRSAHPDHCSRPGCAEEFERLQAAVAVLRDRRLRRRLDHVLPPTWEEIAPLLATGACLLVAGLSFCRGSRPAAEATATGEDLTAEERVARKRATLERARQREHRLAVRRRAALRVQRWWAHRAAAQGYASRVDAAREKLAAQPSQRADLTQQALTKFLFRLALGALAVHGAKLVAAFAFPSVASRLRI